MFKKELDEEKKLKFVSFAKLRNEINYKDLKEMAEKYRLIIMSNDLNYAFELKAVDND